MTTDVRLDKATHTYWQGDRRLESVGALVKRVTPPFDANYWAERKAKQRGVTREQVLAEWAAKRDKACDDGHELHTWIEKVCACHADFTGLSEDGVAALKPKLRRWTQWWLLVAGKAFSKIRTEVVVSNPALGYAGTADFLAESSKTKAWHLMDWKQNKELGTDNKYGEKMLAPFQDLPNCELSKYSLQLSLYRLALEAGAVATGAAWIVHVTEDDVKPYKAIDLRARAQAWLAPRA